MTSTSLPSGRDHLAALAGPLAALRDHSDHLDGWGRRLAGVLLGGGRLLAVGNGGSAAQAQHLTSELVGRYRDDRPPFAALALHAETSSLTAIVNDYGADEAFARQVRAHGRRGDVLVALSTSGRSPNVLAAVAAAREVGLVVWALTGPVPNPLAGAADEAVSVAAATATVQEVHQVAVHLLCAAFEVEVAARLTDEDSRLEANGGAGTVGRPDGGDHPGADPGGAADAAGRSAASHRRPGPTRRPGVRPLVVVGDALLDCDLDGAVERLCPDAPAPVVDAPTRCARPGGAALAATVAASGGRPVVLVTALGRDEGGAELAGFLADAGVEVCDLGLQGPTPQKVRVRAGGRTLVRLDHGGPLAPVGPVPAAAAAALGSAAAILVSDYGRGLTAERGLRHELGRALAPIVWDPHPRGTSPVSGVRLATPNRSEAAGFVAEVDGAGLAAVTERARALLHRWTAAGVAITLGPGGALLVEGDGLPLVVPAHPVAGGDVCGAGDRFAAVAAAGLADGALPSEAVTAAVKEASAFVATGGSAGWFAAHRADPAEIDVREGRRSVSAGVSPDGGISEALAVIGAVRARGGTIVATGGCFDVLHSGHVRSLEAARALGHCLVVCLNSDRSVRRLKGPDRPVVPEADRAAVLAALGAVDAVVLFDGDTPAEVLGRLRPDVFAKGGDYEVGSLPEAALLASWGGQAVILPYVEGRSTTRILEEAMHRGSH